MDFMYKGETSVPEAQLTSLIKVNIRLIKIDRKI